MRRSSAPAFRQVGSSASWIAAVIAAMIVMASPARAGCNPSDIFDAAKQSVSGLSDCAGACADGVGCAAAAAATGVLTEVAAAAGQGAVDSFCSKVQGTASQILGQLQSAGGSKIGQNVLGELADVLSAVGSPAKVMQCACATEQGVGALGSDLGDCMEDALCWLQDQLGFGSCDCTRPPPALASCPSIDVKKCKEDHSYSGIWNPACIPSGSIGYSNPNCKSSGSYMEPWQHTLTCTTTAEGTLVVTLPPTAEGTGCGGAYYCFCPAPMKADWHQVPNPGSGDARYAFSCDCPDGTHPGETMPNGISSCLCDNTNQAAIFGFAPFGMCPPPACPTGQVRIGGVGDCVTPCADASQGMTFDGSCCNPAQMTSCGQCCQPGTLPDPKSGTCVPRPQPPK
jgi:hypothetical protein